MVKDLFAVETQELTAAAKTVGVQTSCYGRLKKLPEGLRPVCVSVGAPGWYKGDKELRLAPTRAMLKMARPDYEQHFAAILAQLDPRGVYDSLGPGAVMLCWEAPNIYCHRRVVAEWFEEHLGIVVPEVGFARGEIIHSSQMPYK